MLDKHDITIAALRKACERKGYQFFEAGDYNLNLIGIRTEDAEANTFNDYFTVSFKQNNQWVLFVFDCTTDPGLYWRLNPMNKLGTAVLVPGQYSGAYMLGEHKNKFPALVQAKALPVYRDDDLDAEVDVNGTIDRGWHGINIHPRNPDSKSEEIGKWSAGCQVIENYNEHMLMIIAAQISERMYGNRFTYTLLQEKDFL